MRVLLFIPHDDIDEVVKEAREFILSRFPDYDFTYISGWEFKSADPTAKESQFNYADTENWVRVTNLPPLYEPWAAMYAADEIYLLSDSDIIIMKSDCVSMRELQRIVESIYPNKRVLVTTHVENSSGYELKTPKYSYDRFCLANRNILDVED